MKTITKSYFELKEVKAKGKTFTNDKGVEVAYYEYRIYVNETDYVVVTTKDKDNVGKSLLKQLVKNGCITMVN